MFLLELEEHRYLRDAHCRECGAQGTGKLDDSLQCYDCYYKNLAPNNITSMAQLKKVVEELVKTIQPRHGGWCVSIPTDSELWQTLRKEAGL